MKAGIIVSKEIRMDCSIAYHHAVFERAMAMRVDGRVRGDLHSRKVGPDGLIGAFDTLAVGTSSDVKILFDPRA